MSITFKAADDSIMPDGGNLPITKNGPFDFCDWGKKIRFKESSWE